MYRMHIFQAPYWWIYHLVLLTPTWGISLIPIRNLGILHSVLCARFLTDFCLTQSFDVSLCRRVRMCIQNPTKRPKRRRNTENDRGHDRRVRLVTYQNFLNSPCRILEQSAELIASWVHFLSCYPMCGHISPSANSEHNIKYVWYFS